MEKITYPLLCYPIAKDAWLGLLVGTDYQMVEKDIKSLKNAMSDFLFKQYKKTNDYPYVELSNIKHKIFEVKIRPTYKEESGHFPFPNILKVPVSLVFGENDNGYYECYFPLFGESFYYYDNKQLKPLATHFATNKLNAFSPEQINKYFLYPEPSLEEVTLKVNYERDYHWGTQSYQRQFKNLNRFAEKYPYSKAERKKISLFPEVAWEVDDIINEISNRISQEESNILIVGDSGTGKSAIIKQVFKKIHTQFKKDGTDKTFWRIMPQRITAGSKYLGEWEQVCEQLIDELQHANGTLWVEDISRLVMLGGEGPEDSIAAFFSSFLREDKLHMVGEVTPSQLESMRRLLPGFIENFKIVKVKELPEAKIFRILEQFASFSKQNLKINIHQSALEQCYRLLLRYYPYEKFPGKAVRFLSRTISDLKLKKKTTLDKKEVVEQFSKQTGLPELFLRDDLKLSEEELNNWFLDRIIGQNEAVNQVCEVVKIYKAGLNNPHKPISTLLFAGPTGVGKTATAKALADYFFGKGQKQSPLIRIDMSEFRYPGQITQLIGSGKNVGKLIKEIREKPFAVLLLDEVEKADPSIFDALLTVLDEGRLVDAYGRETHFRNVIIIMTSNLGASQQQKLGFKDMESQSSKYTAAIERFFRPEFVNRIDDIVLFNSLQEKDVKKIIIKELNELKLREGFHKNKIDIIFGEELIAYLMQVGFDERYGARPLQRAIEDELTAVLAYYILENNDIKNSTLFINYSNNNIKITKQD